MPMNPERPTLTTRQGHPVSDNQSLRSVGERGPATLENYQFIEKITHFDRERIPERVVHARGTGAHGWFEPYGKIGNEPAARYTRAKVLTQTGMRTPVFLRFSTVIGARESPESKRDPRGFAIKFKTVDGNWDLVGNNLKVFFIRDAIKFPDMIHAFKPDPVTNREEPWRFYDFIANHPESLHMVTWVKSPWGIPANYRQMEGSGVNTYKLVNDQGVAHLVKFHFQPRQGVRNLTSQQAAEIQARDVGHATRDLYDAIERGDFPEWEMCVQVMSDDAHEELDFDPLDDTKRWPEDQFPLLPVGRLVLDRNPDNVFAETEQSAFGTGVLVDGIDFSDDKMLQGRTLSYSDTQRYRVGPNYLQLPINAPQEKARAHTNQQSGQMAYYVDPTGANKHVNYEPSMVAGLREAPKPAREYHQWVEGHLGRYQTTRTVDDYRQAGDRYRSFEPWERDDLVANLGADLRECPEPIRLRMVWHFWHCDEDYGRRVAEAAGVDLQQALQLPPLEGKPAPHQRRDGPTYTSGRKEEPDRQAQTQDEMASAK
ncbi:catalase [Ramlibacter tataouinensis]|uniref:Catalase n=1 Tax=Ramlibacter tataouinensis (strain ATCC BAA-407 / DSM 14655 / LMG 21543 / TTB310) TaxID=365046 RepID=F5XYQ2_RAMTT|nr:catalase [Ramlibacter tataouinensis]AEG94419.1 Candidate hydroperoxidase II [Ramlibacter tataouinensis TTB310]